MSEHLLYLVQQLLNGLTIGSTYALIAIGYTMVYGIIGMINFAHGEVYMIGSYVAFMVMAGLMMMGIDSTFLLLGGAFLVSIIITGTYGWTIERVAYRPLRGGNRLIPLISAIGMSIFLQNMMRMAQGSRDIAMPTLISGGWTLGGEDGFQASLSYMQLIIFVVTFITMLALTQFIGRSRMGRACRACSEDIKMANLLGIDTHVVISITFVLGATLAAVAGVLLGMYYRRHQSLSRLYGRAESLHRGRLGRHRQHTRRRARRPAAGGSGSPHRGLSQHRIQGCDGLRPADRCLAVHAHRHSGSSGGRKSMKHQFIHACIASLVLMVLSFWLLGFRLETEGSQLLVVSRLDISLAWLVGGAALVFWFQLLRGQIGRLFQASISGFSTGFTKLVLPSPEEAPRLYNVTAILGLLFAVSWPFMASRGAIDLATLALIYIMLGLGLNVVVGLAGLLDLGYVGFYAVGAYSYALLNTYFGLSFWECLPIAGLMAAPSAFCSAFRYCGYGGTIWPSSPWGLARSSASCSTT